MKHEGLAQMLRSLSHVLLCQEEIALHEQSVKPKDWMMVAFHNYVFLSRDTQLGWTDFCCRQFGIVSILLHVELHLEINRKFNCKWEGKPIVSEESSHLLMRVYKTLAFRRLRWRL